MKRFQRGFLEFLPAIATIGSALIGGSGQRSANKSNEALSAEQMAFQERMSSTAYQRATMDMQKAGLNPMLAYSQGGASSPVGSMPQIQNVGAAAVSSASSAMGMMSAVQQMQLNAEQVKKVAAETEQIKSLTMEKDLNVKALAARIGLTDADALLRGRQEVSEVERQRLLKLDADARSRTFDEDVVARKAASALKVLQMHREQETFESDVAGRKAASVLTEMGIPAAKAESDFWKRSGELPQWLKLLLQITGGVSNARRAGR